MRRFAGIAAVLFLLLLPLAACGGAEEKAGFDPEITLQALADAGAFSEELEELDGDTAFTLYGLGNSGLEREDLPKLESAVIQQRENTVLLLVAGDLEAAQGVLEQ